MTSFNDIKSQLENTLDEFSYETLSSSQSSVVYRLNIEGDITKILLLKTSLTGSERPKPQIRVFVEKIVSTFNETIVNHERFFCLVHCSHSKESLKFNNIVPSDYIISLESSWSDNSADRIDIRSVYDYIEQNPTTIFKKVNKLEHSVRSIKQATIFKNIDDGIEKLKSYLKYFDSRITNVATENQETVEEIAEEVHEDIDSVEFSNIGVNKIYFGAPGTGKSFGIQEFIRENGITDYSDRKGHPLVYRITLHPEFSYFDFVGQIMPRVIPSEDGTNSTIDYDFIATIFTKALETAIKYENQKPVFLILEEMSRANVAAVFGDLFQLLDRNIETGISEYKINNDLISNYIYKDVKPIYIPSNLFIIGTVNTNDQNVFVMDTAFKRRFEYEYINANILVKEQESNEYLNKFEFKLSTEDTNVLKFEWLYLYRCINKFITKKLENGGMGLKEDKQLGQFFIKFKNDDDEYNFKQIYTKLLQYLYEDVESASYSDVSLFREDINSFSEAFVQLSQGKNIFSNALLEEYRNFEKDIE